MGNAIKKYLLGRVDSLTPWVGAIGLFLQFINWQSGLFVLFAALIVVPQEYFAKTFSGWAGKVKEELND